MCLIISVLLFSVNRIPPKKEITEAQKNKTSVDLSVVIKSLSPDLRNRWDRISSGFDRSSPAQKVNWKDSAILFWDTQNRPEIAADFALQKAELTKKPEDLNYAGQRFYYAVKFIRDLNQQKTLYGLAAKCFGGVLRLEPNNTDAKIDLASCLVEAGDNPMQGISMLREIEKRDSNNVRLQLSFGFFSAKSQQWDKAIKRFKKALQLDPSNIEVHLHLANAYEQSGMMIECVNELQKFVDSTSDPMAKTTIQDYMQKLKKTNN